MAQGDIYRVTAQQVTNGNDIFQWVWHYIQTTSGTVTLSDLATAIVAMLDTAWSNIASNIMNSVSGDSLEIAVYDPVSQEFNTMHQEDITGSLNGTAGTEAMPHQNAAVVKFFTSVAKSIGKKFISGLAIEVVENQDLAAGLITNLAFFGLDFVDTLSAGGASFAPGNFNLGTEEFTEWNPDVEVLSLVRTQDRRIRGVGL